MVDLSRIHHPEKRKKTASRKKREGEHSHFGPRAGKNILSYGRREEILWEVALRAGDRTAGVPEAKARGVVEAERRHVEGNFAGVREGLAARREACLYGINPARPLSRDLRAQGEVRPLLPAA